MYTAVIAVFFFEHLFMGRSLVPLDVLNQMLLPREAGAAIEVQTHYPIDEVTQLVPNAGWWRDSVRRGEFPLWNPHLLGGHPQHGATGWAELSIAKLPLLLPVSLERAYTLTLVLLFWLAGVTQFVLLRELGRSPPAAFLGACAWALCSNFLMFHWLFLPVFVWMPWILVCWERAIGRRSLPWAFGSSVSLALAFLSGSVQMVAYVGFLWGVWALGSVPLRGVRDFVRTSAWMLGIFGLAAVMCAAQWIPMLEFLPRETQRLQNIDPGAFGLKHAVLGPIAAVVMFLAPALAGSPQTFDLLKVIKGNAIDFNAYIGVVGAGLAVLGVCAPRDRRTRNLLALVAVVMVFVFLTPLQKFLYHRFLLLAVFAAVVIAARGFDAWLDGTLPERALRRMSLAAIAGAALLLVGLTAGWGLISMKSAALTAALERQVLEGAASNQFGIHLPWLLGRVPRLLAHYRPWNLEFLVPAVALAGFGITGLMALRSPAHRNRFFVACVLLSVLDLSVTLRNRVARVEVTANPFYPMPAVLAPVRQDPDWFRVYRWMPGDKLTLMDNLGWSWGLNQFSGYESMSPNGLSRLPVAESDGFNRVLDLACVKYVLTKTSNSLPAGRFETVAEQHGVRLSRNRQWLPLVQLVTDRIEVSETPAVVAALGKADFDPTRVVYVEARPEPGPASAAESLPRERWVRLHDRTAQRITAEVGTPVPGVVVLSETWYPGWKVRVNGREARLLRADAYLQAVAVGPGVSQLEWVFDPVSFRLGAWISLAGLLLGGAGAIGSWFLQKPST